MSGEPNARAKLSLRKKRSSEIKMKLEDDTGMRFMRKRLSNTRSKD
jgi:hypothetical protein